MDNNDSKFRSKLNFTSYSIAIKDVAKSALTIRNKWARLILIIFSPLILLIVIFSPLLVLGLIFVIASKIYSEVTHLRVQGFAVNNGFGYERKIKGDSLVDGSVFHGVGNRRRAENILYSHTYSIDDLPFMLFSYKYSVGSGKYRRNYSVIVLKVDFNKKLPHMFLDDYDNGKASFSLGSMNLKGLEKFELEGDFQEYFHLYIEKNTKDHLDVLTVLTPDFMHFLIENPSVYDVEVNESALFVFNKGTSLDSRTSVSDIIRVAEELVPRLKKATKYLPDASNPVPSQL